MALIVNKVSQYRAMHADDNTSTSSVGSTYYAQHFQNVNNIYELQSAIHQLTIQKQKSLILYHNAISNHSQEKASLIKEINQLQNSNTYLNNQNSRLSKELTSLSHQYHEIKKSHQNLEQVIQNIPAQGTSPIITAASLERSKREYQQMRREYLNIQDKLRQTTTKLTDAKSQIFSIRTNYQRQLTQLQSALRTALQSHNHELQKLKNQHKSEVETLTQQIQFYKTGTRSVETENSAMISEISELHKRINDMQVRQPPKLPTPTASSSDSKTKYRQLLCRFQNLIEQHSLSIQNQKSLAKELETTRALCSSYTHQIMNLQKRLTNTSTQYRVVNYTEIPMIAQYTQPLLQQLTHLKQFVFESEKTKVSQERKINQLLQQMQQLKEGELKHSEKEINYLRQKNKNYEEQLAQADDKVRQMLQQMETLKVKFQKADIENMKLKEELKDVQIEINEIKAIKRVSECDKCYTFESEMKSKVISLERQNRKLYEEKSLMEEEINQMDYQVMMAKREKFQVEKKFRQVQEESSETTRMLKEKTDEVQIWKRKYFKLQAQKQSEKVELSEKLGTVGVSFKKKQAVIKEYRPQKSKTMVSSKVHQYIQPEEDSFVMEKQAKKHLQQKKKDQINSAVELDKDMDLGSLQNLKPSRRAITDRVRKQGKLSPKPQNQFDIDHFINSLKKENSELKALIQ